MPIPKTISLFVATDDPFAPCITYILRMFASQYGLTVIDEDDPAAQLHAAVSFRYRLPENFDTTLSAQPVISIQRGHFFSGSFLKNGDPPDDMSDLAACKDDAFGAQCVWNSQHAAIDLDVIASAFYMLSGYEAHMTTKRDASGRILSSHVPRSSALADRPVVNHWFRQLYQVLHRLAPETFPGEIIAGEQTKQTIALTHDVDLMRKYQGFRGLRRAMRHVIKHPAEAAAELRNAAPILLGRKRDPYDSFDYLFAFKERIGAASTVFFMGNVQGKQDSDYLLSDPHVHSLMQRCISFGDETALHVSWHGGGSGETISQEKAALEAASGTVCYGSRQHYLRFNAPETWHHLVNSGIRYDSSLGYPDKAGFRNGWSGCFHPFDLRTMRELPILEIPLVCMDVSLANYEKLSPELCLDRLNSLRNASCDQVPGGAFVFLWHNIMADDREFPRYWEVFERFLAEASGSARFVPLIQLCDEYEAKL